MVVLSMTVGRSHADVNKDKQECTTPLMGLATCLPYVGGQAKAPTQDCCTGIKQVLKDNKKCLCILGKDRNDPSVNLKFNASLALSLPRTCHSPDTLTVPQCLELLHLAPNSTEAKAFADFAQPAAPSSPTAASTGKSTASSGTSSDQKATNAGANKRNPWLAAPAIMFYGALMTFFMV